jgi:hypothetical protein
MESLIYSNQGLATYEGIEQEIKSKAKIVAYLDLSNNLLT